jgi:hypothetical protein
MFCRATFTLSLIAAATVVTGETPCHGQSVGCARMPSTWAQYLGWGYGAGHHAPMVRTPWQHPDRVQRMAFAPPQCGPLAPAPYEIQGCYGGHCGEPTMNGFPATPHAPPTPAPDMSRIAPGYRMVTR